MIVIYRAEKSVNGMKIDEAIRKLNPLISSCKDWDCDENKDLANDVAIVLETAKMSLIVWESLKNFYSDYKLPETLHTIHIDICSYNKAISDINAQTEIIQNEDQQLELRLQQLNTEQNAISTEMDSVSKVIEDNVEKTFKVFA